jgi:hypothetical protein
MKRFLGLALLAAFLGGAVAVALSGPAEALAGQSANTVNRGP